MPHKKKPCPLCEKGRPCLWHRVGAKPVYLKDLTLKLEKPTLKWGSKK